MDEDKRLTENSPAGTGEESPESAEQNETDKERIEISLEITHELLKMLGEAWGENEELKNNLRKLIQEHAPSKVQATPVSTPERKMMDGVIIVDDSRLMVKHVTNIISSLGFHIIGSAANGETGADLVIRNNPKLVILDHYMPVMNGLQCIRAIRMQCMNTRIIVCTDDPTEKLGQEYTRYDVSAIISKPIQLDRFTRAVRECMSYDFSLLENL